MTPSSNRASAARSSASLVLDRCENNPTTRSRPMRSSRSPAGFTPSDLLVDLSQDEIDDFEDEWGTL